MFLGAMTAIAFLLILLSVWSMVPTAKDPKPSRALSVLLGAFGLVMAAAGWSEFRLGEPCEPKDLKVDAIYVVVGCAEVDNKDFLILIDSKNNTVFCRSYEKPANSTSLVKVVEEGDKTVLRAYFPPSPVTPKKLANGK